ncbi:hypothetical protein D3C86_1826530 [compost metagenome]
MEVVSNLTQLRERRRVLPRQAAIGGCASVCCKDVVAKLQPFVNLLTPLIVEGAPEMNYPLGGVILSQPSY